MPITGYRVDVEGGNVTPLLIRVVSFWDEPVLAQVPMFNMAKELPAAYLDVPGTEASERVEYEGFDRDEADRHMARVRAAVFGGGST